MIPIEAELLILMLFLLTLTTFAATRGLSLLAASNAITMICVPLLGVPVTEFGFVSNAGAIFYSVGMYGFCAKFFVYGLRPTHDAIRNNMYAFLIVYGSILLLDHAHVLDPMFDTRVQMAGARLVTFALIQSFHVYLLGCRSPLPLPLHAVLVTLSMQVLDSVLFYPLAYAGLLPPDVLIEYAITGFLTRCCVTILSALFLAVLLKLPRHRIHHDPHP